MLKMFTFICLLWDALLFYSRTMRTICLFFLLHFTASLRSPRILIVPLDSQRSQMICANIWLGTAQLSYFYSGDAFIVNGDGKCFYCISVMSSGTWNFADGSVFSVSFSHALKSQFSLLSSLSDSSSPSGNCNTAEKGMRWCSCCEAGGKKRKREREKRMKQWITVTGELIHAGSPTAMFCSVLLVWFSKHYSEASDPTCHVSAPFMFQLPSCLNEIQRH